MIISREMTKTIIPNRIKESFTNLYDYMNKTTVIQYHHTLVINDGRIKIINYDFHDRSTQEILYIVVEYNEIESTWRMKEKLYSAKDLETEYALNSNNYELPKSERVSEKYVLQLSQEGRVRI